MRYLLVLFLFGSVIASAFANTTQQVWNNGNMAEFESCTEAGIDCFFMENYRTALISFDYVVNSSRKHDIEDQILASALWGQALCYACLDEIEAVYSTLEDLSLLLLRKSCANCSEGYSRVSSNSSSLLLCDTKYFQQNRDLPVPECIARVQGTARELRKLCSPVRNRDALWLFNKFIDNLEESGIRCCTILEGKGWVTCVDPLIVKWKQWKIRLPQNPYEG